MLIPIKKMSLYAICVIVALAFAALHAKESCAAEPSPVVLAFYCPSEEIDFIGELLFPLSVIENSKGKAQLDLSDIQVEKMRETDKAFLDGVKDVLTRNENKGRDPMGGDVRVEDHVIAIGKLAEDARKRTNDILKPHQMSRLKELLLQFNGVLSVPKKDLRQLLRLDRKQERAIDEIRSGIFKRIDETTSPDSVIASSGRCKFATSTNQAVARSLEEGDKSIYRLLSPEQKEQIEKLKGKSASD
jgi:hypothetical protein